MDAVVCRFMQDRYTDWYLGSWSYQSRLVQNNNALRKIYVYVVNNARDKEMLI